MEYVIPNNWLEEGWDYSFREGGQGSLLWGGDVSCCHLKDEKVSAKSGFTQREVYRQRA